MHRYEEINTNDDRMNNLQANGKQVTDVNEGSNDEEISTHKRHSAFSIDFGTSKRKDPEGLSHLHYPVNDQNK